MTEFPFLGHGVGLRPPHYRVVLGADEPDVDWFEIVTENFLVPGGNPRRVLRRVAERWPVVFHGVSLSLGSLDALDDDYLAGVAQLAHEIKPAWISDHVSWGSFAGRRVHDLWPLPYTEEALAHTAARIRRVQERLRRRILVENVSTYVTFAHSTMPEWEFLAELCRRADCGLLLDVNNVYVSAQNLGFDAGEYVDAIPADRIGQIHLAGHSDLGTHLLDTHDHPVGDPVWALYRRVVRRVGRVSTLIEWDDRLPPFARLLAESRLAALATDEVLRAH